jgi:hypothetical protein
MERLPPPLPALPFASLTGIRVSGKPVAASIRFLLTGRALSVPLPADTSGHQRSTTVHEDRL